MTDVKIPTRNSSNGAILLVVTGFAAAILLAGMMVIVAPKMAQATPQYAQETGLPCAQCHASAGRGKDLKPFGKAFKDNGFKVPKKK
jgi:mono/diheme cytochrome c family protein